jgi:hypothetical protein
LAGQLKYDEITNVIHKGWDLWSLRAVRGTLGLGGFEVRLPPLEC